MSVHPVVVELVCQVFDGIEAAKVTEKTGMDTVDEWDSLSHLNMIVALEKKYGIPSAELRDAQLINAGAIQNFLSARGLI